MATLPEIVRAAGFFFSAFEGPGALIGAVVSDVATGGGPRRRVPIVDILPIVNNPRNPRSQLFKKPCGRRLVAGHVVSSAGSQTRGFVVLGLEDERRQQVSSAPTQTVGRGRAPKALPNSCVFPLRSEEEWNALKRVSDFFKGATSSLDPEDFRRIDDRARSDIAFAIERYGARIGFSGEQRQNFATLLRNVASESTLRRVIEPTRPDTLTDEKLIEALEPTSPQPVEDQSMALSDILGGLGNFGASIGKALAPVAQTALQQLAVSGIQRLVGSGPQASVGSTPIAQNQQRQAVMAQVNRAATQQPFPGTLPIQVPQQFSGGGGCGCRGGQQLIPTRTTPGALVGFQPRTVPRGVSPLGGCR